MFQPRSERGLIQLAAANAGAPEDRLQGWRNCLFCLSPRTKQFFVAVKDTIRIYSYKTKGTTPKFLGALQNQDSSHEPASFDEFHSAYINRLSLGLIGDQETLVSVDGLGRVYIRFIRGVNQCTIPLILNVGESAWGIGFAPSLRLLAISSNAEEVNLFDLAKDSSDPLFHRTIKTLSNTPDVSFLRDGSMVGACSVDSSFTLTETSTLEPSDSHEFSISTMFWSITLLSPEEFLDVPAPEEVHPDSYLRGNEEPFFLSIVTTESDVILFVHGNMHTSFSVFHRFNIMERVNMVKLIPNLHCFVAASQTGVMYLFELITYDDETEGRRYDLRALTNDRGLHLFPLEDYLYGIDVELHADRDAATLYLCMSSLAVAVWDISRVPFSNEVSQKLLSREVGRTCTPSLGVRSRSEQRTELRPRASTVLCEFRPYV